MSARNRVYRAQARLIREQAYQLRRKNDQRDLNRLPWWRQRTIGNAITVLLRQF